MLKLAGQFHWSRARGFSSRTGWPVALIAAFGPGIAAAQTASAQATANTTAPGSQQDAVAEVVVTGSYLRGLKQEDLASPVLTIDQEQMARTGVLSLGDLTRYIPQNVGSVGGIQDLAKGGVDTRDARSADLRGLGSAATLVLLNGRRVVPYEGYVNLDSLTPSIAISRVETVLDGA